MGDAIIDAYSLDSFPADDDQPNDPASVRFRLIAEILLRGIQRCVAGERELQCESGLTYGPDEPVLGNLESGVVSFAQFEREIIGERIRDKLAAQCRRGQWTGGLSRSGGCSTNCGPRMQAPEDVDRHLA